MFCEFFLLFRMYGVPQDAHRCSAAPLHRMGNASGDAQDRTAEQPLEHILHMRNPNWLEPVGAIAVQMRV